MIEYFPYFQESASSVTHPLCGLSRHGRDIYISTTNTLQLYFKIDMKSEETPAFIVTYTGNVHSIYILSLIDWNNLSKPKRIFMYIDYNETTYMDKKVFFPKYLVLIFIENPFYPNNYMHTIIVCTHVLLNN